LFHRQLTDPHQANSNIVPIKVWKLVETTPLHHANMLNLYETNFESRNQLLRLWMLFLSMILTGLAGLLPSHFLPPGETIFCDVLGFELMAKQVVQMMLQRMGWVGIPYFWTADSVWFPGQFLFNPFLRRTDNGENNKRKM